MKETVVWKIETVIWKIETVIWQIETVIWKIAGERDNDVEDSW